MQSIISGDCFAAPRKGNESGSGEAAIILHRYSMGVKELEPPRTQPSGSPSMWRVARMMVPLAVALGLTLGCGPSNSPMPATPQVVANETEVQEGSDVSEKPDQRVATPEPPVAEPLPADDAPPPDPFPRKVPLPAAALEGGVEWLNTAGPITLSALRGKVVLLDFWTYCCINCMHVLPDLKKLEEKYANQLVVIGVHSAKFETERDSQNIREAILRYEIEHPVVNDADMIIWRHFDVHAWPTLMLIDPESNLVGYLSGEGVYNALDQAIGMLVKFHRAKGTLNENPVHFELESARAEATPLRFPGKVLADAATNRLFIADSNHNRIVVTKMDGEIVEIIGTGRIGRDDGAFEEATFFRPQGMALDGDRLYVADTENHVIRQVDLQTRKVSTVVGVGVQGSSRSHLPRPAAQSALNSPWDLWLHEDRVYIAMAGPHQIWVWNRTADTVQAYAGSGREDIEDGELPMAAFAQPSGLTSDGEWLFVADSEGSSIRAVPLAAEKTVWTVVGTADLEAGRLFEFGDVDGENGEARLQHPLGVAWHEGSLFVADTYNNKIKVIDVENRTSTTFVGDRDPGKSDAPSLFDEPSGLSAAAGKLYVADTNNHLIRIIDIETKAVQTLTIAGLMPPPREASRSTLDLPNSEQIALGPQELSAGSDAEVRVRIQLPDGYELNDRAPMSYRVEVDAAAALLRGDQIGQSRRVSPPAAEFAIPIATAQENVEGTVRITLTYYLCREGSGGICEIRTIGCSIPIRLTKAAKQKHIDWVIEAKVSTGTSSPTLDLGRPD